MAFDEYVATAIRCGLSIPPKVDPWVPNIISRLKDHGPGGWQQMLVSVERSGFLCGGGGNGWRADLDWLCKPKNFAKVLSGQYGNGAPGSHAVRATNLSPAEQARQETEKAEHEATYRRLAEEEDAKCSR